VRSFAALALAATTLATIAPCGSLRKDAPVPIAALILAGRRSSGDAVADSSGLRHRALLPIAGVPMLERVVDAIARSGVASSVTVSSDDPELIFRTPALASLATPPAASLSMPLSASPATAAPVGLEQGFLRFHRSGASPATSVASFFTEVAGGAPVFVTTGDHPLLTPEMVRHFVEKASASRADFVVGMVPASVYRRRFPDQPRTFIPLRGEKYSGANLFVLRTPKAAAVATFWTRAEAHRKTPWKLVRVFGLPSLLLFALGRLDLAAALRRASSVIGAEIEAVELPFAEAALDVDKEADRLAVEAVFAERAAAGRA
jgi:CTP:molybdopterin cytidylyltransferase MocA